MAPRLVVAEAEIAGHLKKKRVVPGGYAHLVDIGGTDALLDAGGRRVRRRALSKKKARTGPHRH